MKKRYKISLLFLGTIIFLFLVLWFFVTQTKFVESQVARYLATLFDQSTPAKVKIGKINYSLRGELILDDLQVEYAEKGLEYQILDLKKLKLNFNIIELLRKKWNFNLIEFHHPRIQVRQTPDGRILIPSLKRKKSISKETSDYSIFSLMIKDGYFDWYGMSDSYQVNNINLNLSLNKYKGGLEVNLLNGDLYLANKDGLGLKKISGKTKIKSDSFYAEDVSFNTVDSKLKLKKGTVSLKPLYFSLDLEGKPLNLGDIRKISGTDLKGVLDLAGSLDGDLESIRGNLVLEGDFFGKELKELKTSFEYEKKKFSFYSIRGLAFQAPVECKGELDLGQKPESYYLKGKVRNLNVANVVSTGLQSDLSGELEMEGRGFKE
ncbi:MAG: hypothetical protein OEV55_09340, partial [candidate division Zixibacteria bacterium]|nr:hypothetical protein [candidate division Zixibacteria bacterium]